MAFVAIFRRYFTIIVVISLYKCCKIHGSSLADVDRLFFDIMEKSEYNNRTRPIMDQSQAVVVNITFNLATIKGLDDVSGVLSLVGGMHIMWIDDRFKWDPDDYNGTTHIAIPQEEVWRPDLVMVNTAERIEELGHEAEFTVRYNFNGVAIWSPVDVFKSTCNIDMNYYPFDIQNCSMQFVAWGYTKDEIVFNTPSGALGLDYYTTNGEWTILETMADAVNMDVSSMAIFSIRIQRIPIFFIISVVLPIVFLCFLNTLVFAIPVESGEKVSYSITVFLAFAVFMTIIAQHLPTTSTPISMICYYLLLNVIGSVLVCFFTIVVLRLYHMEYGRSVPNWVIIVHSWFNCSCSRKTKSNQGLTYGQAISQCLDRCFLYVFLAYFLGVLLLFLTTAAMESYTESF